MFTAYWVTVITYVALGTSGRDCIMLQCGKLFLPYNVTLSKTCVSGRLQGESF
jgi:hypothetical protein